MNARGLATTLALFAAACGAPPVPSSGPSRVDLPVTDGTRKALRPTLDTREAPPPSGPAKPSAFPAVARTKTANGMDVAVVTTRALPIVQVRLVVRAGAGFGAPGVAELTAAMLKDGGTRALASAELLRRVETLGATLTVHTDFDATVFGLALTKDHLDAGLSLLAQVVREPRFDDGELAKLKARKTDEAEESARSSGAFTTTTLLFRELFPDRHPYGTFGPTPGQIARVDGAQIRDFYRRFYVPKAASLVLVGDVGDIGDLDPRAARELATRTFGGWAGGDPPKVEFGPPRAPRGARVLVAHRPRSTQSDVVVATLAPPRRTETWARVRVANQIIGGSASGRLFADVREQRSLAYRTGAQILELAHGPQPLVLVAGTETSKTARAVSGLLDNIHKMVASPPTPVETDGARRYLADIFAVRMETAGAIADMLVTQDTFGLPDGYWDAYRKELRATDAGDAADAAKTLFQDAREHHLVIVAGDADLIAGDLTRFGDVTVVDPEKDFKLVKTLPKAAP